MEEVAFAKYTKGNANTSEMLRQISVASVGLINADREKAIHDATK